ncbi:hypothetical protein SDC9_165837 [bioreactor metagenome]|uniref:Uncharacterized protein n=1 Tax=bioreactor metagenome TaxID=1076179 RepID=A0A645FVK5_9ZZZZ
MDAELLALFQKHLASSHGGGVGAYRHGVVVRQPPVLDGFHDEQQSHYFRDGGGLEFFVLVPGEHDRSGLLFHQQVGGRVYLRPLGMGGHGKAEQENGDYGQECDKFFHIALLFQA